MKQKKQRGTAVTLCILMLILSVISPILSKEAEAFYDPFASMYDSDELFIENLEKVMPREKISFTSQDYIQSDVMKNLHAQSLRTFKEDNPDYGYVSDVIHTDIPSSYDISVVEQDYEELLEILKSEDTDRLSDLNLTEPSRDLINSIYEQSRTDRFIIRYKKGSTITSFKNLSVLSVESAQPVASVYDNLEEIVLSERVNPKELADTLKSVGMGNKIEYMQPDFMLDLSGIELEYISSDENEAGELSDTEIELENTYHKEYENQAGTENDQYISEDEIYIEELRKESVKEEIIVALIDTGVDISHPDLEGRIVKGWNFVNDNDKIYNSENPVESAHGTHIAGVIAGSSGEYVKIMPLKVFEGRMAYTSDIIYAIAYAQEHGARVVNCSFGSSDMNLALRDAIISSDMLFIAAAGNARSDLSSSPVYPAAFGLDNIISVASLNKDSGFSYYSNYSNEIVDIAALGRDVESTAPENSYGLQSGTSVSAGFVSAAAGELYAHMSGAQSSVSTSTAISTFSAIHKIDSDKRIKAHEVRSRLFDSADMLSNLQDKVAKGRKLNLSNAIRGVEGRYLNTEPADDFDVNGYQPTPDELYELFSSGGQPVKIAAGYRHALILLENGTVWAWGADYNNISQVIGLTNIVDISAGSLHNLALRSDGTVWYWEEHEGKDVPAQFSYSAIGISAGGYKSLIIYDVSYGIFAAQQTSYTSGWTNDIVVFIADNYNVSDIIDFSVFSHSIILLKDKYDRDKIIVMGNKDDDVFGSDNISYYGDNMAVSLLDIGNITKVEAGNRQSFALDENGLIWYWGIGLNDDFSHYPQISPYITDAKEISARGSAPHDTYTYIINTVLKSNGKVSEYNDFRSEHININNVKQVAAGSIYTIALKNNGTIWGWGVNNGVISSGAPAFIWEPVEIRLFNFEISSKNKTIEAISGKQYDLILSAEFIKTFEDQKFTLEYDSSIFDLEDLCIFTGGKQLGAGVIDMTDVEFKDVTPGELKFIVKKTIPQDKEWSGILAGIRFKAKKTQNTVVTFSQTK